MFLCFSPADALHIKYPFTPITIYATKRKIDQYPYRFEFIRITEIGEAQAMMKMVKNKYLNNLHDVSTDIKRMHMDLEFWYQQHYLDSDSRHLNNHMIDIVQKYMRGNATQIETYIELGSTVYTSTNIAREFSPEAK
jgi:hypothetical protein